MKKRPLSILLIALLMGWVVLRIAIRPRAFNREHSNTQVFFIQAREADKLREDKKYEAAALKYLAAIKYKQTLYPDLQTKGEASMHNQAAWCYILAGSHDKAISELNTSLRVCKTSFAEMELTDLKNPNGKWTKRRRYDGKTDDK